MYVDAFMYDGLTEVLSAGICDLCRQRKDNPETFYWNSHRSLRNKQAWKLGPRDEGY